MVKLRQPGDDLVPCTFRIFQRTGQPVRLARHQSREIGAAACSAGKKLPDLGRKVAKPRPGVGRRF